MAISHMVLSRLACSSSWYLHRRSNITIVRRPRLDLTGPVIVVIVVVVVVVLSMPIPLDRPACQLRHYTYRSHCRSVQLAMIHKDTMKTRRTVPGHMVISVLRTNRVLKLMRLRAPIDLDEASVNSLLSSETDKEREKEAIYSKWDR